MPVIAIANPKGGCGKSTTSLLLSTTLTEMGANVAVFDCDPNQPIQAWRHGRSASDMEVVGGLTEANILSRLDEYRTKRQFVILDLQGTASLLTSRALSRTQLVVIPIQASTLDADQATKAICLVKEEEQSYEREIPYKVVFTRTSSAIKTRLELDIIKNLEENRIPTFREQINERSAFKAMFHYQLSLNELDTSSVNGVPKARDNAMHFTSELIHWWIAVQKRNRLPSQSRSSELAA